MFQNFGKTLPQSLLGYVDSWAMWTHLRMSKQIYRTEMYYKITKMFLEQGHQILLSPPWRQLVFGSVNRTWVYSQNVRNSWRRNQSDTDLIGYFTDYRTLERRKWIDKRWGSLWAWNHVDNKIFPKLILYLYETEINKACYFFGVLALF